MEEIVIDDFDVWLANFKIAEVNYVAVFDPFSGKVISVGPDTAFKDEKHKVNIDTLIAESIIDGKLGIEKCLVDINSNEFEISEIRTLTKLDDILHRVVSLKYSEIEKPDVYITHIADSGVLIIELSEEFGGTKKVNQEVRKRNFVWDGDTEMKFYITEYNDPNLIFDTISVKINELIGDSKVINDIDYSTFSVYTRRLFKNYVIEYK